MGRANLAMELVVSISGNITQICITTSNNHKIFLVYICNFSHENFLTIRYGFPAIFGSP